jgi:hypothetical protein
MRGPRERPRWLRAALFLVLLSGSLAAQYAESDPRNTEDPRDAADPRSVVDPRDEGLQPGIEVDLAPLEGADLLEELYAGGNTAALSDAISKSPWDILAFIQKQAKTWLELSGKETPATDEDREQLQALELKLRDLGQLADLALLDSRFEYYVDTLMRWDKTERVEYQELQELYKQGGLIYDSALTPEQTLPALTPLRQGLAKARQLDDLRSQAACLSLIGRILSVINRPAEARVSMLDAVDVGRSVRDLDAVWDGLAVIMRSSIRQQDYDSAQDALRQQHRISSEMGDTETARLVLDQLLQLAQFVEANNR